MNSNFLSALESGSLGLADIRAEKARRRSLEQRGIAERSTEAARERCQTLAGFVREAWHVVEPAERYVHGWHIDAICQHLEAVTYGQLTRLLINVPPGTMKSLLSSVFWPAWEWGPAGMPSTRIISSSYSEDFVRRDTRRMRDLVNSEWFQTLWPAAQLVRFGEESFANVSTGWREGMPFKSLTGGRAHRLIIDDAHSVETAESDAERKRVIRTFRESVPTRLVDPVTSAIVIIMQRLHVEDIAGVALSLGLGYEHLMLPMEFEPDRRCHTSIGFKDPRTYEGELLFPERFPREVIERDKIPLGSFAVAGQFQQRPTLREGGLFKRTYFNPVKAAAVGTRWVRKWDLAATKERAGANPAYTAGVKLGLQPNGRLVVGHVIRVRDEGTGVRKLIKDTAALDGPDVEIGLPKDPGQAGKVQAQDMVLMLNGYIVHAVPETGDKAQRAEPIAAQGEAGNLDMVIGDWNETFMDELTTFPGSKFKDQVDALSGAHAILMGAGVFATAETQFTVEPLKIPSAWGRIAAIDTDNVAFGGLWGAYDRQADTVYLYDEYLASRTEYAVHAEAMRQRGAWIPALFEMRAHKRSEAAGERIAYHIADLGIELMTADVDVPAAIDAVANRLATGRLKVFSQLGNWFAAYRRYSRDDKGEIVEKDDHLMRATAMIVTQGITAAVTENRARSDAGGFDPSYSRGERSSTGY